MQEIILKILEVVGTVSFAVSGTFVAIKAKFDAFGVIVVGCTVAVGGGIIRDVISGKFPPLIFSNLGILAVAAVASIAVFIIAYLNNDKFTFLDEKTEIINNYFDALGLATFTVMGVEFANVYSFFQNPFFSITLGVITGVGGGLLRDIFTENTPYIFKKHIYAVAAVFGALIYYLLRRFFFTHNTVIPTVIGIAVIVSLRVCATIFCWSLPKVKLQTN